MIIGKIYKLRHPTWFHVDLDGQTFWADEHFIFVGEESVRNASNLALKFLSSMGLCTFKFKNHSTLSRDLPFLFEELWT